MEKKLELVSVIIATYNSEKKIPAVIQSIKRQTYKNVEILIVDGGSVDGTCRIARDEGCRVLHNPQTNPNNAKYIGINNAQGKYILTLDHDEVLQNCKSIEIRVNYMENNPCYLAYMEGYKKPEDYPLLNQYVSEYGDPFTLFIYRFSRDSKYFPNILKKNFKVCYEDEECLEIIFEKKKKQAIMEVMCAGTLINFEYFSKTTNIKEQIDTQDMLFYMMLENGVNRVLVTKDDPLLHYSVDSLKAYLPKIKWRIVNNIHFPENAKNGFVGRQKYQGRLVSFKKYVFVIYALSVIVPFFDGTIMAIRRRNPAYLLHAMLCFYTILVIIFNVFLKIIGKKPAIINYDGTKNEL